MAASEKRIGRKNGEMRRSGVGSLSFSQVVASIIFEYMKVPYFNPTAMRQLTDGSFLVVERAFDLVRGVRMRLVHFPAGALKPDAIVDSEELARLASPYTVDNMEGLAVTTGERGETLLWIIADDNFNPLQRNLLMLFELEK